MASLPRLGREATQTITDLAENGSLLTPQQEFCQPRKVWRPITAEQTADLACRFQQAADKTRTAAAALAALKPDPSPSLPIDTINRVRAISRAAGFSRDTR